MEIINEELLENGELLEFAPTQVCLDGWCDTQCPLAGVPCPMLNCMIRFWN